jgi:hypothetical protein
LRLLMTWAFFSGTLCAALKCEHRPQTLVSSFFSGLIDTRLPNWTMVLWLCFINFQYAWPRPVAEIQFTTKGGGGGLGGRYLIVSWTRFGSPSLRMSCREGYEYFWKSFETTSNWTLHFIPTCHFRMFFIPLSSTCRRRRSWQTLQAPQWVILWPW